MAVAVEQAIADRRRFCCRFGAGYLVFIRKQKSFQMKFI
jgi:hypothetical protein